MFFLLKAKRTKKERFSLLLFRLYEKVTKKYTEGGGPLDSRGAVQSAVSTCFFRNLIGSFLNQLSCFEPGRDGALLRKDL